MWGEIKSTQEKVWMMKIIRHGDFGTKPKVFEHVSELFVINDFYASTMFKKTFLSIHT